jgi:hypothetical protein
MRHVLAIFIIILIASSVVLLWAWLNGIPFIEDLVNRPDARNDEMLWLPYDYEDMKQAPVMLLIWFGTIAILSFIWFFWNQKKATNKRDL